MMDAGTLELPRAAPHAEAQLDKGRVRDIVLIRIAFAGRLLGRDTVARELAPIGAHLVSADVWQSEIERDLAALADAGLAEIRASSVGATEAGIKRATMIMGGRGNLPKSWAEARDVRLVAKALGIENEAPARLKALRKPDGLRARIVIQAFNLKLKGVPTPIRLRTALAQVALSRAFGDKMKPQAPSKSGLSPKAGRVLAGQLASKPQDFRTDSRLVAALAANAMGITRSDLPSLQLAVLRRYVTKGDIPAETPKATRRRKVTRTAPYIKAVGQGELPLGAPAAAPATSPQQDDHADASSHSIEQALARALSPPMRPDFAGFVATVRQSAGRVAEGWAGNRKAFISRVWRAIQASEPHWALTEIEFKCMLTEAHRAGQILLANADLKDDRNLRDVQESAVAYRNAVFHFVRVDD